MATAFRSIAGAAAVLWGTHAAASSVTLVTETYAPYNMHDAQGDKIVGSSTEKISEIMRRSGDSYSLDLYPWSRAFLIARAQQDTCVFSAARTPAREPLYKWVGPVAKIDMAVFARASDKFRPASLAGMRNEVIGTKRRDANTEFLASLGYTIDTASSDAENPRKLLAGRIDYWVTSEVVGMEVLKKQGLANEIVPLFVYKRFDMYLACNANMDQARIDRWNRILRDMNRDGTTASIEARYK